MGHSPLHCPASATPTRRDPRTAEAVVSATPRPTQRRDSSLPAVRPQDSLQSSGVSSAPPGAGQACEGWRWRRA